MPKKNNMHFAQEKEQLVYFKVFSYTNSNPPSVYRTQEVLSATKENHNMSWFCPVLILVNLGLLCILKYQDLRNGKHLLS